MANLPVISLAAFDQAETVAQETEKLYQACYKQGFLYLKDHGVDPQLVNNTIEASRRFFHLPLEVKAQFGHEVQTIYPKTARGYVPLKGETLYGSAGPDPKELFDLGIDQPVSDLPFTGPNILPDEQTAPQFAASHLALQQAIMNDLAPRLIHAIALALGLDKTWFDPYFTRPTLIQRTIYYPPGDSFAGKHTDNGFFTVLIQEQLPQPSLRVYTNEQWIDAPCLENTFVINLGDLLQHWTNGRFVSTPHEVQHRLPHSRITVPFFVYPNIDAEFQPLFGGEQTVRVQDVMLKNFESIWIKQEGAGRAQELH